MKLPPKWLLSVIAGLSCMAVLGVVGTAMEESQEEIPIRFRTYKEFRRACLQGNQGVSWCSLPVDTEFTANPDYRTVVTVKFRRHRFLPFRAKLRDVLGDSVGLALIGLDDTAHGGMRSVSDSVRTMGLDFGQADTAKLDISRVSRFLSDSTLISEPFYFATSMVSLIANPHRYQLKKMVVSGTLRIEHECFALYLHKEDYSRWRNENALQIRFIEDTSLHDEIFKKFPPFNGETVTINGVFEACTTSVCEYPGALSHVSKIYVKKEHKFVPLAQER
ncbi:MAG: hypothetical protein IPK50_15580 [Fibrobacterota bacterium]|nr:hypothetical protein [Fibrobacterota bacterium]QQS03713.1 MAG: hypothetical protein IPK50_15580 [Fibrobacterota bacterium]